ncbi:hypothetical protein [Microbulbifer epialgicus]|uniref:Uncharacterized protein n=1 Tax=Microbulbifer epialgicus TaxID=393907 RepID=A0ABV4P4Y4_9GAMM
MSIELWVEGVIVEFRNGIPCKRSMIESVGSSEVVLADIKADQIIRIPIVELDEIYSSEGLKMLAESRDFGDLKFLDLTEKEQQETNRKCRGASINSEINLQTIGVLFYG